MALSLREHGYYRPPIDATPFRRPVEHAFIDRVYAALSPVYDLLFGAPLHPGRDLEFGGVYPRLTLRS